MEPTLFSIGKAADICSVSTRTLRFYEQNGLVMPDHVDEETRYRYYSYETLLRVQTIRYLLDEGFPLEEIKDMLHKYDLDTMKLHFNTRIEETQLELQYLKQRLTSLNAWHSLLTEGDYVLKHNAQTVHTKHLPVHDCFFFRHQPKNEAELTAAYIEATFYSESKRLGNDMVDIGGSINVYFESFEDRIHSNVKEMTLLQTMYPDSDSHDNVLRFGGFLAAACYHIGNRSNIASTYQKIIDWCSAHHFALRGDSFERHVLDGYSVIKEDQFVTEVLLPFADEETVIEAKDW